MISTSRIQIKKIRSHELQDYHRENEINHGAQLLRDTDGACVHPLIVRRIPSEDRYEVVTRGQNVFVALCAIRARELYQLSDVTAYILDDAGDPLNPLTPTQKSALEQQICFLGA